MKITNIKQNINFKSGLSSNIIQKCNNTSTEKVESILQQYNIKADFENNQTVAFSTINAIGIINNLNKKLNFLLLSIPQIGLYSKQDLIFNFQGYGFCIPETQLVLKNKCPALTGSIFYEKEERIEALNSKLDMSFINKERSSSHFLSPFIHEIMHSVYLNYIYSKYGYEGNCPYTKKKYYRNDKNLGLQMMKKLTNLSFDNQENLLINDVLGRYSTIKTNQYHEVFSETFTKIICDSLKGIDIVKNPIDVLKNMPIEFRKIIAKVISL